MYLVGMKMPLRVLRPQSKRRTLEISSPARMSGRKIGVWCNGSTTDSGSVSEGSSPSTPTNLDQMAW